MDDHLTVGEFLGLVLDHEPARYDIGTEPAEQPLARPRRRRASPLDRTRVAPFFAAARAGVPDVDIARAARVTVSQVRGWRHRLGIKRKPGTTAVARLHGALLNTPELVRALRAYDRVDDCEPPQLKRVSYEELEAHLASLGLSMRKLDADLHRERVSNCFARRVR